MPGINPIQFFKQSLKSDSYHADEIINIYLLRPLASIMVWILYPTGIAPNQVTVAAILAGIGSAFAYWRGSPDGIIIGGVLILVKDILDDADGQLARAKQLFSRRGRFLDSIGDFLVNIFVFTAITVTLYQNYPSLFTVFLGIASFFGITLRVSYHVFYQVSYLHLEKRYQMNRISEEITDEDRHGDQVAYFLQRIFIIIYGWQDRIMLNTDRWCKGAKQDKTEDGEWYGDRLGLFLSGLLGFGTEYMALAVCSWLNLLYFYLIINVVVMNGILFGSILYRKLWLSRHRKTAPP